MNALKHNPPVILQTGFRIFFLGAAFHAVLSMLLWLFFYAIGGNIFVAMPLTLWHGHEMIFGYTMAVVAGFLLTAVTNWTGLPTLSGKPLLVLFLLWLAARILAFMPNSFPTWPMMLTNCAFLVLLVASVSRPIILRKQWKQSAVISKILLLSLSAIVFYTAFFHADFLVERKVLCFAVYMIVGLILTVGRRVLPFFIERGVGYQVTLRNSRLIDLASMIFLAAFSIIDIFWPNPLIVSLLSGALAIIHIIRLSGWYTHGIWKKPLLWVLFLGYTFLILGFILKFFAVIGDRPADSAIHAFTAGGIGIFTLGMMARVAWGHTGRNILEPPKMLSFIFISIITSAFIRVIFPIFSEFKYILWIVLSQTLWIIAFVFFIAIYYRVLITPRLDGKIG